MELVRKAQGRGDFARAARGEVRVGFDQEQKPAMCTGSEPRDSQLNQKAAELECKEKEQQGLTAEERAGSAPVGSE